VNVRRPNSATRGKTAETEKSIPLHATTVPVTEACPAIDVQDIESLRDRLKRRLAEANVGDSDDGTPDQPPPAPTQQSAQTEPSPAAPADTGSDDDPFCAFIARKAVRGELTPEGGARIPDYCRSAMDKAKSCAEQKCSMADIIGREARQFTPAPSLGGGRLSSH
jgi:hypothetical protein